MSYCQAGSLPLLGGDQALLEGQERGTVRVPPTACGRCCFYFLQPGVVFQDATEPSERVQLMGTRPAP